MFGLLGMRVRLAPESVIDSAGIRKSVVPYSVRAKDSIASGQSVIAYDPKGPLAEAYRNVAREIANHG